MSHLFGSLGVMTVLAIIFVPYWIPTIVTVVRHVDRKVGIVLLNAFAGWTVVGWVAALIWSFTAETENQARLREAAYANMAAFQQSSQNILRR